MFNIELHKVRFTTLSIVLLGIFLVIPTGSTALYYLNKSLFMSSDIIHLALYSAMCSYPFVVAWVVAGYMALRIIEQKKIIAALKSGKQIEEKSDLEYEKECRAIVGPALVCVTAIMYLSLGVGWTLRNFQFKDCPFHWGFGLFLVFNAVIPALFVVLAMLAMMFTSRKDMALFDEYQKTKNGF